MAKSNNSTVNDISLANRVYVTNKIINIYDICNSFDTINSKSETFITYKEKLQSLVDKVQNADASDEALEQGILAEEKLAKLQMINKDGNLLPDEEILQKLKEKANTIKEQCINGIIEAVESDNNLKKNFYSILKKHNVTDLQKGIIDNPSRGKADRFRDTLALDYAVLKESQPKNAVVVSLSKGIEKQIASRGYAYQYAKENKEENKIMRNDFNKNPNRKQKFLKLMGNILSLGEQLSKDKPDERLYATIRELSGNDKITNENIDSIASRSYEYVTNGLWVYKNTASDNRDIRAQKENYIATNIGRWISDLKSGKNNIMALALMSPKDEKEYLTANEQRKEEIEKKHVSIHHKIPEKYHAMIKAPDDKFDLNHISNMMMVIGGALHDRLHRDDMNNMVKLSASKDDGILLVPGNDMEYNNARKVSMDVPEPESISKLRPEKVETNELDIFSLLMKDMQLSQ